MYINAEGAVNSATTRTFGGIVTSGALLAVNFCTTNSTGYYIKISGEVQMSSTSGVVQFGGASAVDTQTSTFFQQGTNIRYYKLD